MVKFGNFKNIECCVGQTLCLTILITFLLICIHKNVSRLFWNHLYYNVVDSCLCESAIFYARLQHENVVRNHPLTHKTIGCSFLTLLTCSQMRSYFWQGEFKCLPFQLENVDFIDSGRTLERFWFKHVCHISSKLQCAS